MNAGLGSDTAVLRRVTLLSGWVKPHGRHAVQVTAVQAAVHRSYHSKVLCHVFLPLGYISEH